MAPSKDGSQSPALYTHKLRANWGVGVFAGETDGKQRYLFENGEERTLAGGFRDMMRRVDDPNPDQEAIYARLKAELAKRGDVHVAPAKPASFGFLDQLACLHRAYPAGLSDPKWIAEIRGEGAEIRAPRHRQPAIRDAQEKLSRDALKSLIKDERFDDVWKQVIAVLRQTDLVPSAQLKLKGVGGESARDLALAVRELLYGRGAFDTRFGAYLVALTAAFGQPPHWELATALCALVHPTEHLCVDPTLLRKQLKASSSRRTVPAQPSSAGYASSLAIARLVASKLTEQGETPRDLLEVRDFVAFTLKRPNIRGLREAQAEE
jgi:hypothetical protein